MDLEQVPETAVSGSDRMELFGEDELDAMFDDAVFPNSNPDIFSTVQCGIVSAGLQSGARSSSSSQQISSTDNASLQCSIESGTNILPDTYPNEAAIKGEPTPQPLVTENVMKKNHGKIRTSTSSSTPARMKTTTVGARKMCNICHKPFSTGNLRRHMKTHTGTGNRNFSCKICDKKFRDKYGLRVHQNIHTGERPYACKLCGKSFANPCGLLVHTKIHFRKPKVKKVVLPPKPKTAQIFSCSLCPKEYKNKSCLQEHILIIHEGKRQPCTQCSLTFPSSSALRSHIRKSHTKDLQCSHCKRTYSKPGRLAEHMKVCKKLPYKCDLCNSCFKLEYDLLLHTKLHSASSSTQCTICNKTYTTPVCLRLHMRTHSGYKPYKCEFCEKSFSHGVFLKEHMVKHTGEVAFKCDICGKEFSSRQGRRYHIKTHSIRERLTCQICNSTFTSADSLKIHLKRHDNKRNYECMFCNKCFMDEYRMRLHLKTHTKEKPYFCLICGEEFLQHSMQLIHHTKYHGNHD